MCVMNYFKRAFFISFEGLSSLNLGIGQPMGSAVFYFCVVSIPSAIVWSKELRVPHIVLHPAQSTEQGGLLQQPTVI